MRKKRKPCTFSENDLKKFLFTYDFGDNWKHEIELEEILKFNSKGIRPRCIDGARNCPPDDCGSTYGYKNFLKAISNPNHPEHEDILRWIGGKFDSEKFSVRNANRALLDIPEIEASFEGA